MNSIFKDFSGLVGVIGHFSSKKQGWKGGETTECQANEKSADGDDCEVVLFHNCDFLFVFMFRDNCCKHDFFAIPPKLCQPFAIFVTQL